MTEEAGGAAMPGAGEDGAAMAGKGEAEAAIGQETAPDLEAAAEEGTGRVFVAEDQEAPADSGGTAETAPPPEENGFAGIQSLPVPTEPNPDKLSRHGGQFADFLQEVELYSALAEEYLAGQPYTLLSYEWDYAAGAHRFTVSLPPPEGVESPAVTLVLVGTKGEIDEERQPDDSKPPDGSD